MAIPLRLENLLAEAGGSVYAWYEDAVLEQLDPDDQRRRRAERTVQVVFLAALIVATGALALAAHNLVVLVVAALYLLVSRVAGKALPPPPAWTVALSALTVAVGAADGIGMAVVGGAVTLAAGWATLRCVVHVHHALAAAVFHLAVDVAAAVVVWVGGPGWGAVVVGVAVGMVVGWVTGWFSQGRRAMSPLPLRKLPPATFTTVLPDPPSTLPTSLQRAVAEFEARGVDERHRGMRSRDEAAIDMKKIGGAGERQTALLLLGLRRGTARIFHDAEIPGATQGGNIDHLVVTRSGGWVLDSKRFGSVKDPGSVRRTNTGNIVHVTGHAARPLESTLRTLAWAIRGVGAGLRVPLRGLLVIHNADVDPGLSVVVPPPSGEQGDVQIDIIPATHVVSYLDAAPEVMSRAELAAAVTALRTRLVSATHGSRPRVVTSLGGGPTVQLAVVPGSQDHESRSGAQMLREQVSEAWARTRPEPDHPAPDNPPATSSVVGRAAEAASPAFAAQRLREQWAQMDLSEPASPDEVPDELRGLCRGSRVTRVGFNASNTDLVSQDLVCVTGPCHRPAGGPFVWICHPDQWDVHAATGQQVAVSTVPVSDLVLTPTHP